jgi:septum formation protein
VPNVPHTECAGDTLGKPMQPCRYILGSRSPQRLELLRLIVPAEQIEVVPPASPDELSFDGLTGLGAIHGRQLEIVREKSRQVCQQMSAPRVGAVVITADTVIAVSDKSQTAPPYTWTVLGQPPETDWANVVRGWFCNYYAGWTHVVTTAMRVILPDHAVEERQVTTLVTMRADVARWIDWYLNTGEPRGKAGGYALQGAGSLFIERVEGSLSNVIGLPLEALLEILQETQG